MENNNILIHHSLVDTPNNLLVHTPHPTLVDSSDFSEGRGFFSGLGGLAIGLLGFGILLQQITYRGGLSSRQQLQRDFLEQQESRIKPFIYKKSSAGSASSYGNRKKKIRKSANFFNGYGIVAAASNAIKTIQSLMPEVITDDTADDYDYEDDDDDDEYTLEEFYFNQLEKNAKKRRKKLEKEERENY